MKVITKSVDSYQDKTGENSEFAVYVKDLIILQVCTSNI